LVLPIEQSAAEYTTGRDESVGCAPIEDERAARARRMGAMEYML
jgi:hypothetical protein